MDDIAMLFKSLEKSIKKQQKKELNYDLVLEKL